MNGASSIKSGLNALKWFFFLLILHFQWSLSRSSFSITQDKHGNVNEHKLKRTRDISFFYLTSQLTLGFTKIRLNSRKCNRMNHAKCQGYNISIIWQPQIHFNTDINITLFHTIWHTKKKKRCCQRAFLCEENNSGIMFY